MTNLNDIYAEPGCPVLTGGGCLDHACDKDCKFEAEVRRVNWPTAESMPSGGLVDLCRTCGGTGVGTGLSTRRPSPVDPGLRVWTPPDCVTCGGAGVVPLVVDDDPVCSMHDWPWSYHGAAERGAHSGDLSAQ